MIVTMQGLTAVAANATVQNVLAGQRYERSPFSAGVGNLYCCGSAAGLTAELNVGGTSITPPQTLIHRTDILSFPTIYS